MDCTIIIPVGPGHERLVNRAIGSVMQAAEEGRGIFADIHILAGKDDGRGRSATRNALLSGPLDRMLIRSTGDDQLKAPYESEWLFFLDADDFMCNKNIWGTSPFETVNPFLHDYDCIWGPIAEYKDKNISMREQSGNLYTYKEFLSYPPYQSVQIGHFVRRSEFFGFNEEMEVGEDVELYVQEWRALRCLKQEIPLFVNVRGEHSWTSGKGPTGRDWNIITDEIIKEARRAYRASRMHEGNVETNAEENSVCDDEC